MERYLAHRTEDGREQTVEEHLAGTAALAEGFGGTFGAAEAARLCGRLHDIGKFSKEFQRRILENGPRVDHATAGAQAAAGLGSLSAAFCIAGHHGGLPDGGNRGDNPDLSTLSARLKRVPGSPRLPDCSLWRGRVEAAAAPLPSYCGRDPLTDAFFTRMLYSCLVDADYLDTEAFMNPGKERGGGEPMPALLKKLEASVAKWWDSDKPLNRKRCEVLRACLDGGAGARGLYTLTVPTGGGKTVSSLAFALSHAAAHSMDRVIYVIPYNSIVEQTAETFRNILGEENVLEHHSNVDYEQEGDDPAAARRALSTENWDASVVVTTSVQFFESLYANRSSRCRKLHNIANSVVIFDEAQTLPLPCLRPCVSAIAQLVEHYGVTAVLCTATQPALDGLFQKYAPGLPCRELAPDVAGLYDFLRRVTLKQAGVLSDDALAERLMGHRQALCIVNSRKEAQAVFARLEGEGNFHLSTLMYPAHRRAVLAEVRARLKAGLPCRVVSTSLIEAGVDVDFPAVYRAEAGLDSILQAAGRCNREGNHSPEESIVTVFRPESASAPLFGAGIGAMRDVAKRQVDLSSPSAIEHYFRTLYLLKGEEALDQHHILSALSGGINGNMLPFATVAERFRLIDDQTRTVYIPLGGGEALAERLRSGERTRGLFRKLGQYGVNVYPPHFKALLEAGDIEILDEEAAVLTNPALYSEATGLSLTAEEGKGLFI